ncbi:MAG TPA: signal peptide peptidase SppA [Coriobacteriia bacterium]|nr:signal peptide peptidase SppA [Coriobacteriia bacterium]
MEHDSAGHAPGMPSRPAPPVPPPAERPRSGCRWFAAGLVVLLFAAITCSGLLFLAVSQDPGAWETGDAVAVLYLDGMIAGTGSIYNGIVTPEYFVDQLERAEDDPSVRAILIRVDSPGGTIAASQEIAMELERVTKPVVVSVGDICASGAYMVASQSDEIVATPTSSVGSIGVISQIPNVEGLLDELGVEFTVLTAGEHKDAGSPFRSLTETETALFQQHLDLAYHEFIRTVAEGRNLPEADVEEMATGWIWPGTVAEEMGLVDTIGTFNDALDAAAERGGIVGEPRIVTYIEPDYGVLMRALFGFGARLERLGSLEPDVDRIRDTLPR